MLDNVVMLDSYRPRVESVHDEHDQMVMTADVRMLRQIASWAECLAEIAEHFDEPLHPSDRKKALNALAVVNGHPLEM